MESWGPRSTALAPHMTDDTWECGSEVRQSPISKATENLDVCFIFNPRPLFPNFLKHCVGHIKYICSIKQ